jgi:hypothetical protein
VIKLRNVKGAGHLAHMVEKRNLYRIVVGKHEGKKQVGIPSCSYEDNKRIDVKEIWMARCVLETCSSGSCTYDQETSCSGLAEDLSSP